MGTAWETPVTPARASTTRLTPMATVCRTVATLPTFPAASPSNASGDFDCTGTLDLRDVGGLQNCFTGEGGDPLDTVCWAFDFDFDGDIDISDYAVFLAEFDVQ